jgi:lysozyme
MRTSTAGINLIKQSEGFRATPYKDTAGLLTIGYGHRIRPTDCFSGHMSQAQAETVLAADLAAAEQSVTRLVKVPLTQGQFDALVDFVFNLGSGRLASSTLLKDLNAGLYTQAAEQILIWDHAGPKVLPGLQHRRQAEFQLFTGKSAVKQTVNAAPVAESTNAA